MNNVNPKTNVRYGVIQGNNANELMEDIFNNGTNLSFESYHKEMGDTIESLLDEEDVEGLTKFIRQNSRRNRENAAKLAKEFITEQGGEPTTKEDIDAVFEQLELSDYFECDEQSYSLTDSDGNVFQLSYLGGAPLIWCIQTNNIVHSKRLCSPCVPNAGDLDSGLTTPEEGYECYGVPTKYLDEDDQISRGIGQDEQTPYDG